MAISGLARTYDQSNAIREDLEDVISMISPTDTPLFSLLNRKPVYNTKHDWIEDALRGMTSNLAKAMQASDTCNYVLLQDGHGPARFPCSTNYPVLIRVDEELMLGTVRTTDAITCTRGYGDTATAAHSSNATVELIADQSLEGADARTALSQARTKAYNYTQVFDATVLVSGTEEAVIKAGLVETESDYQLERRLEELKIQVERSMVSGERVVGSSTTFRAMGGLRYFISTNKTNASSAAITEANIETDARTCFDAGGNPSILLCNSFQAEKITGLYKNRIRSEPEAILGGALIQRIRLPVAGMGELAIIVDRHMPQHEYYILDGTKLFLGVLINRAFAMQELAKAGDATKAQVVGEYTLIVKNETAHARRYGLATS